MKRLAFLLVIVICMAFAACSARDPDVDKPAHELAKNGMDEFTEKDYRKSIVYFEKLRDWYPFSKFAKLAELKIADAHYHLKEYDDAVFSYEEFEELHPNNEAIPYVIQQIGNCYFEQLDTIDRDQTPALKAVESYEKLIKNYPDDPLSQEVLEKIRTCQKSIAENQLYIGNFYLRTKHYKSALARFQSVASEWTQFPEIQVQALEFIQRCETAMAEEAQKRALSKKTE
jgi:outer membrane protein assembly factor BamD